MKLRNKETGEIVEITMPITNGDGWNIKASSLAELCKDWEDYEEPKGKALYWMILTLTNFIENEPNDKWMDLEDCKQMLEKLETWQRLKDKGFSFDGWTIDDGLKVSICTTLNDDEVYNDNGKEIRNELDLIFGGNE